MIRWLLVLLASICIVYSLVWWTAAWFVRSNVVQRINALELGGISSSIQQHGATGWLNLGFHYQFNEFNVKIPTSGIMLEVPGRFQSGVSFFNPFKLITELNAGTVLVSSFFRARLGELTGVINARPDLLVEAFDVWLKNVEFDMFSRVKLVGEDVHISYQASNQPEEFGRLRASARFIPNSRAAAFLKKLEMGILLPHHALDIELEAMFYPSGPLINHDIYFWEKWLSKEGRYIVVKTLNAPVHEMLIHPSKALIFKSKTNGLNVVLCPKQCTANSGFECAPSAVFQNGVRRDESAIVDMSLPGEFAGKNSSEICEIL